MKDRTLVLDANILIRAVLRSRVRRIVETYSDRAAFFVPDLAFFEAEKHLALLIVQRGSDPAAALLLLRTIVLLADLVGPDVYGEYEAEARRRLGPRDPDDWPILASALALDCPIWTEDTDFFGCGAATWTSQNIEVFLAD